ncbi:hypothetical protein ES705_21837 [subsurface metagenome]
MKNVVTILLGLLVVGSFLGCELAEREFLAVKADPPDVDKGSLVIALNGLVPAAKTLAPPIAMEVGSYDIRGVGPDSQVDYFEDLGNTTGTLVQFGLRPGTWTISVDARNPSVEGDPTRNGTIIGYGVTDPPATLTAGAVTTIRIDIRPVSTTGILDLTLIWAKKSIPNPRIVASLTPTGSSTSEGLSFYLSPPGNPEQGTYRDPARAAGFYLLVFKLFSDNGIVWGTAEAVRIIAGETTSQIYTLN